MEEVNLKMSLEELMDIGWKVQDSLAIADVMFLEKNKDRILYDCEVQQIFYTYRVND